MAAPQVAGAQLQQVASQLTAHQTAALNQFLGIANEADRYIDTLLHQAECNAPGACSTSHESRKRKRASPYVYGSDRNLTEQIAMPSTPTQDLLPLLHGELLHHQLQGVRWLVSLYSSGRVGILADELEQDRMVQVIGVLSFLRHKAVSGPFLIVTHQAGLAAWASQLHSLMSGLALHTHDGSSNSREVLAHLCSQHPHQQHHRHQQHLSGVIQQASVVVLVTPDVLVADCACLCRQRWKYIAVDACRRGVGGLAADALSPAGRTAAEDQQHHQQQAAPPGSSHKQQQEQQQQQQCVGLGRAASSVPHEAGPGLFRTSFSGAPLQHQQHRVSNPGTGRRSGSGAAASCVPGGAADAAGPAAPALHTSGSLSALSTPIGSGQPGLQHACASTGGGAHASPSPPLSQPLCGCLRALALASPGAGMVVLTDHAPALTEAWRVDRCLPHGAEGACAPGPSLEGHPLWLLLQLVLPEVCGMLQQKAAELHAVLPAGAGPGAGCKSAVLSKVSDCLAQLVGRFVLGRTAEEVDLSQLRRNTEVNLYDLFNSV